MIPERVEVDAVVDAVAGGAVDEAEGVEEVVEVEVEGGLMVVVTVMQRQKRSPLEKKVRVKSGRGPSSQMVGLMLVSEEPMHRLQYRRPRRLRRTTERQLRLRLHSVLLVASFWSFYHLLSPLFTLSRPENADRGRIQRKR